MFLKRLKGRYIKGRKSKRRRVDREMSAREKLREREKKKSV